MCNSEETGVKCERCDSMNATRNAQMTNYNDEESNYATLCEICQEASDSYWSQMWKDYNGSL